MKNLNYILLKLSLVTLVLTFSIDVKALGHFGDYASLDSPALSDNKTKANVSKPLNLRLSQGDKVRSQSDVISEVKRRYNAEVLRIKLNEKRMVYEVRVLMPNGKVKNITVSARR